MSALPPELSAAAGELEEAAATPGGAAAGILHNLYHSGPGYTRDIFTINIFYDSDTQAYASSPHEIKVPLENGDVRVVSINQQAVFAAGAEVRGVIRVTAPPGRTVAHSGIAATLTSTLLAIDEIPTRTLYEEDVDVAEAGEISGWADFRFAFPGSAGTALPDSYEGDLFSLKTAVSVTILRPWYTFDVAASAPVTIQKMFDLPLPSAPLAMSGGKGSGLVAAGGVVSGGPLEVLVQEAAAGTVGEDVMPGAAAGGLSAPVAGTAVASAGVAGTAGTGIAGAAPGGDGAPVPLVVAVPDADSSSAPRPQAAIDAQLALYSEQTLTIPSARDGSVIAFKYERAAFELGSEHLKGNILFSGVRTPIVLVKLAIVRLESADGEVSDRVVFDTVVLDARRWRARKQEAAAVGRDTAARRRARKLKLLEQRSAMAAAALAGGGAGAVEAAEAAAAGFGGGEEDEALEDEPAGGRSAAAGGLGGAAGAGLYGEADDDDEEGSDEEGDAGAGVEGEDLLDPSNWMPGPADYMPGPGGAGTDPDLPILGEVALAIDLDLGALELTPTLALRLGNGGLAASSSSTPPRLGATPEEDDISIRYFLRLDVYTAFTPDARRWNAAEILLYRDRLYGAPATRDSAVCWMGGARDEIDDEEDDDATGGGPGAATGLPKA